MCFYQSFVWEKDNYCFKINLYLNCMQSSRGGLNDWYKFNVVCEEYLLMDK